MNYQRSSSKDNIDSQKTKTKSSYEFPRSFSTTNSLSQIHNSNSTRPSISEEEIDEIPFIPTKKYPHIILAHKTDENGNRDYLIKFKNKSYYEVEWLSSINTQNIIPNPQIFHNYEKRNPDIISTPPPFFKLQYLIPEKVLTRKIVDGKIEKFLIKWCALDYDEATWETSEFINQNHKVPEYVDNPNQISLDPLFDKVLQDFYEFSIEPPPHFMPPPHIPNPHEWTKIEPDFFPKSKTGLEIRSYQIDGVNFLMNKWFHRRNVILADEMGLGKTLQALMFLNMLKIRQNICGPFLIIAPLSTIPNWERETSEWTNFRYLSFSGSKFRREMMLRYAFFYDDTKIPKFQILITTNEYIIKESEMFSQIKWMVIVVDEAHRLKNNDSKLFSRLIRFQTHFKVLLTGTPLQNNTGELWSLLHFLNEKKFRSAEEFKERFGTLDEAAKIQKLQHLLSKMMLRRLKGDVEKSIPPFEEIIIECPMTQHQKAYYTSIYQKNMEYLTRGAHTSNQVNLHNICMELRKCCNHPYLINGAENQIMIERKEALQDDPTKSDMSSEVFECECLIRSSGKMILLDKLLAKLKHDGHRVLLFSQMVRMLDIIHDYLTLKGYNGRRIDGAIKGEERQIEIDSFNDTKSDDFVFLLCTKAGGVGINLTSADTVIIYDSDWNPQNDIQATARCHRIGQTKNVMVYRFITANSYELNLFETASHKLGLDSAVLGNCQNASSKSQNEEIEKMIKLGAYYAFNENRKDIEEDKINEEDIDSILKRSRRIQHSHIASGVEGSTFSKIQFEIEQDSKLDLSAPDFWYKYIPKVSEKEKEPRHHHRRRHHKHSKKKSYRKKSTPLSESSESTSPNNSDDESFSDEYDNENVASQKDSDSDDKPINLTKKNFGLLYSLIHRFGLFDLDFIYNQFKNQNHHFSKQAINTACKAILHYFLDKLPNFEDSQLLKDTYLKGSQKQLPTFIKQYSKELEELFKKDKNNLLSRISIFFFLNATCEGCTNPPDDIPIPDNLTSIGKPTKWWSSLDDKKLLFHIWKKGELSSIRLTNSFGDKNSNENAITPVIEDFLESRFKNIVKEIRNLFEKYKNRVIDKKFVYNTNTLREALDMWTIKEQRAILSMIRDLGPEKALLQNQIITKPADQVREFAEKLINACKQIYDGRITKETRSQLNRFPETISYILAEKIVTNMEIFEKLKEFDVSDLSGDDLIIFTHLKKFGFTELDSCSQIKAKFGRENQVGKLVDYVKEKLHIKSSRKAQSIERISDGTNVKRELPFSVQNGLVIVSLGQVVTDRPNFHNAKYIYPAGYISEHLFTSIKNPVEKVWYRSLVIDDGSDSPLFRVELKDDPKISFEGRAPTNPWTGLLKAVSDSKRRHNMKASSGCAVSGPQYFGFSFPEVRKLILSLPGADQINMTEAVSKPPRTPRSKQSIIIESTEDESEDDNQNNADDESESSSSSSSNSTSSSDRESKSVSDSSDDSDRDDENTEEYQYTPFLSFNFNLLSQNDFINLQQRSSVIKTAQIERLLKDHFEPVYG